MNSKTAKNTDITTQKSESYSSEYENKTDEVVEDNIEYICDENLTTLQKIHAILLNCVNLSKKQKLEFCESERYFMKQYLKQLRLQNDKKKESQEKD
jgi:hypothetical protein